MLWRQKVLCSAWHLQLLPGLMLHDLVLLGAHGVAVFQHRFLPEYQVLRLRQVVPVRCRTRAHVDISISSVSRQSRSGALHAPPRHSQLLGPRPHDARKQLHCFGFICAIYGIASMRMSANEEPQTTECNSMRFGSPPSASDCGSGDWIGPEASQKHHFCLALLSSRPAATFGGSLPTA